MPAGLQYTVTNTSDSGAGSLRQTILDANAHPGNASIIFSGISGTITLTTGELLILESVSITGPGANTLAISGNNASRVFEIAASSFVSTNSVSISGLIIKSGNAGSAVCGDIKSGGTLTLTNSIISGGTTTDNGGGIYSAGNYSNLVLSNSTVSGNTANRGGGIFIYHTARLTGVTIFGNTATTYGGGLETNNATGVTIKNTTVYNNTAVNGGGGIDNGVGTLTVIDSTIYHNSFTSGNNRGGGINTVGTGGHLTLQNTTVAGNTAPAGMFGPTPDDIDGPITTDNDYNLIGETNTTSGLTGTHNVTGTTGSPKDPLLSTLGNYGGPTQP